jgi:trk system potassium uptake protein TrkH
MFIGASPGSTGGGIKVTTFSLFISTIVATVKGRNYVELFGRRIPQDQVYKTTVVIALATVWIVFVIFSLLVLDPHFSFSQIFFEVISAFSTGGLSTGISRYLSIPGKWLIITSMIIGRIGSITLVLAIKKRREQQLYRYPEERIIIG